MPIYDPGPGNPDGRGLARKLAATDRSLAALGRSRAGAVPDPTPPPDDITPGSLSVYALLERLP